MYSIFYISHKPLKLPSEVHMHHTLYDSDLSDLGRYRLGIFNIYLNCFKVRYLEWVPTVVNQPKFCFSQKIINIGACTTNFVWLCWLLSAGPSSEWTQYKFPICPYINIVLRSVYIHFIQIIQPRVFLFWWWFGLLPFLPLPPLFKKFELSRLDCI